MKLKYFLAGAMLSTAIESLHQDMLGLDRYVAAVRAEWMSPMITVPVAMFAVVTSILLYHSKGEPK